MIGHECRCPGCGSCDAAQEVARLRKLADGKNGRRIAAEHRAMVAERERDELKARLAHAEADAEQAIHGLQLALRNVLMLSKRLRKTDPVNADHLARFCREAGVEDSILRGDE